MTKQRGEVSWKWPELDLSDVLLQFRRDQTEHKYALKVDWIDARGVDGKPVVLITVYRVEKDNDISVNEVCYEEPAEFEWFQWCSVTWKQLYSHGSWTSCGYEGSKTWSPTVKGAIFGEREELFDGGGG